MSALSFLASPSGWRRVLAGAAVAAGLALAGCAQPSARGGPDAMGGPGPGGPGPSMGMMGGGPMGNPRHMERMLGRMLDAVNATPEQRTRIRQIAQTAAADLKPQMDAGRTLRDEGARLFAAPTVDAAAVESLRQRVLAQHDQASRRVQQALLDVAAVLTPEQRATLVERMKQHRGGRWMQRGGPEGERGGDMPPPPPPPPAGGR